MPTIQELMAQGAPTPVSPTLKPKSEQNIIPDFKVQQDLERIEKHQREAEDVVFGTPGNFKPKPTPPAWPTTPTRNPGLSLYDKVSSIPLLADPIEVQHKMTELGSAVFLTPDTATGQFNANLINSIHSQYFQSMAEMPAYIAKRLEMKEGDRVSNTGYRKYDSIMNEIVFNGFVQAAKWMRENNDQFRQYGDELIKGNESELIKRNRTLDLLKSDEMQSLLMDGQARNIFEAEGFWDGAQSAAIQTAAQAGNLFAVMNMGLASIPKLVYQMSSEGYEKSRAAFDHNGIEYDYEKYLELDEKVAIATGMMEYADNALALSSMGAKRLFGVRGSTSFAKNVLKFLGIQSVHPILEGGTEAAQEWTLDTTTNYKLLQYAKENGLMVLHDKKSQDDWDKMYINGNISQEEWNEPIRLITPEQMKEGAKEAFEVGVTASILPAVGGSPTVITRAQQDTIHNRGLRIKKALEDAAKGKNDTEQVQHISATHEAVKARAEEQADLELKDKLNEMEEQELLDLAYDLGYADPLTDKKSLIDYLWENRTKVEQWYESAWYEVSKTLNDEKNLTPFEKHAVKWMLDGDLDRNQIEQTRVLLDAIVKNNGYKDIDEFLTKNVSLDNDTYYDLRNILAEPDIIKVVKEALMDETQRQGMVDSFLGVALQRFNSREFIGLISPENPKNGVAGQWIPGMRSGWGDSTQTATHESLHGALWTDGLLRNLMQWMEENKSEVVEYNGLTGPIAQDTYWNDLFAWVDKVYHYGMKKGGLDYHVWLAEVYGEDVIGFKHHMMHELLATLIEGEGAHAADGTDYQNGMALVRKYFGEGMVDILMDPKHKAKAKFTPEHEYSRAVAQKKYERLAELLDKYGSKLLEDVKLSPQDRKIIEYYGIDPDLYKRVQYGESVDPTNLTQFEIEEIQELENDIYDMEASTEQDVKKVIAAFFQMGRKLPSGSQVMRGRTSVNIDGKFVVDLFATGDITTLAHEFAHVLSGKLSAEMVEKIIDAVMDERYLLMPIKERRIKRDQLRAIWSAFANDPMHPQFKIQRGESAEMLRQMQEQMAEMFESYLATQTAASPQLREVFDLFAKRYASYYKEVRNLPPQYQHIPVELAKLFDQFLANTPIPRLVDREVELIDEETGEKKTYKLFQSRPQISAHKTILKYLRRAEADIQGLHDHLLAYTEAILIGVPLTHAKGMPTMENLLDSIIKVDTNKAAIKYLDKVDAVLLKYQNSEHAAALAEVRETVKKYLAKPTQPGGNFKVNRIVQQGIKDPEIRAMFEEIIKEFDISKRTEKRVRKAFGLAKVIDDTLLSKTDEELIALDVNPEEAQLVRDMDKKALESLTVGELGSLNKILLDLVKYDNVREIQFIANRANGWDKIRAAIKSAAVGNHRYNYLKTKRDTTHQKRVDRKITTTFGSLINELGNSLRSLEHIGKTIGAVSKLANDLRAGVYKQWQFEKEFAVMLSEISNMIPQNGVSNVLGAVSPNEMVDIELYYAGDLVEIKERIPKLNKKRPDVPAATDPYLDPFRRDRNRWLAEYSEGSKKKALRTKSVTLGELMLWYGYSKNKNALQHLLKGGVRFKNESDKLYKFRSTEEFMTIVNQLPDELKKVVDNVMEYYDGTVRQIINDTSMEKVGYGLADEDNYLPLFVENVQRDRSEQQTMSNLSSQGRSHARDRMAHRGFLNMRTDSTRPIYAYDFFEAVSKNLEQVAEYAGLVMPVSNIREIVFADESESDGVFHIMEVMLGKSAMKHMSTWLDNVEDHKSRASEFTHKFAHLTQRAKRGILKLSLGITAIQPVSLAGATLRGVSAKNIARVMTKPPKYSMRDLMAYDASLWARYQTVPAIDFGRSSSETTARKFFLDNRDTVRSKLKDASNMREYLQAAAALDEAGLMPMKWADAITISKILEAIELEGLSPEATLAKFRLVVEKTQPQQHTAFMSNLYGQTHPMFKALFGVFQSQRDNYRGELQATFMDLQDARYKLAMARRTGLGVKQAKAEFAAQLRNTSGKAFFITVISSMLVGAIQNIMRAIGKDDDDDEWYRSLAIQTVSNTLGLLPFAGDIAAGFLNNSFRGWRSNPVTFIGVEQVMSMGDKIMRGINKIDDGYNEEGVELILDGLLVGTSLMGTSIGNAAKWSENIVKEIQKMLKDDI